MVELRSRLAAALAVGALSVGTLSGVAGCAKKSGGQQGGGQSTTPPAATTPAVKGEEGVGTSAPVLADGRHPVYLTGLDLTKRTVTFDLIQFLTGAAAHDAWVKLHPEDPDGPPNDYLIVNDNPKLRTLPFADTVLVNIANLEGGLTTEVIVLADLPAHLATQKPGGSDKRLSYNPYWLTVINGHVTRVEEQFVP